MRIIIPGQNREVHFTRDKITVTTDGVESSTTITPEMKRDAADVTAATGSIITGAASYGIGSAIAGLGSIGIAGLGTAISIPLFPVIGVVAGIATCAAGLTAAVAVSETIDPS